MIDALWCASSIEVLLSTTYGLMQPQKAKLGFAEKQTLEATCANVVLPTPRLPLLAG
jgi:hypothetical protein